jgi:hypothetical protein
MQYRKPRLELVCISRRKGTDHGHCLKILALIDDCKILYLLKMEGACSSKMLVALTAHCHTPED